VDGKQAGAWTADGTFPSRRPHGDNSVRHTVRSVELKPGGVLRVEGTLAQWEERLAPVGVLRVHRNALARLEAIQGLEEGVIQLPSGSLPLSRRRREELERVLELRIPGPSATPRP